MSKNSNDRKRARLHQEQSGKCFYCKEPVGIFQEQKGFPVLEHYIPQHMGGTRVVLACKRCDKMKAMIPGPDFEAIILRHLVMGRKFNTALADICQECKALNRELADKHAPVIKTRIYRIRNAPAVEPVHVTLLPSQDGVLGLPGNSGRDEFADAWERNRDANRQKMLDEGEELT